MKLLFIDLPFLDMKNNDLNLGLRYLLGYLDQNDIAYDLLDFKGTDYLEKYRKIVYFTSTKAYQSYREDIERRESFKQTVHEFIPYIQTFDVVAFSIFFELNKVHFDEMYETLKPHLKPNQKVVIGGNYLRHYDHHLQFKDFDGDVVVGPGEPYFQKMFGLPDFDLYSYNHSPCTNPYAVPIIGSHGCVNKCVFCTHRRIDMWHRKPEYIVKEIAHFYTKYHKTRFTIKMDNMLNDYEKHNDLMEKLSLLNRTILRSKLKWSTSFSLSRYKDFVEKVDINKIREAGCDTLLIGVESYNENVRKSLNKPRFDMDDIENFYKLFRDNGIKVCQNLMIGYISETDDDFDKSVEMTKYIMDRYSDVVVYTDIWTYIINSEYNYRGYEKELYFREDGHWVYRDNTHEKRMHRKDVMLSLMSNYGEKHCMIVGQDNSGIIMV